MDELSHIREEYGTVSLLESTVNSDPIEQFKQWFDAYAQIEPKTANAMVLSTVDHNHHPDSRVVLLKELSEGTFVFYSHYSSVKGLQMESTPFVALNFYWPQQMRQVRVRGSVHRVSAAQSDAYFYSRPLESQLSCSASPQSMPIATRTELEAAYQHACIDHALHPVTRPESWGGYAVVPSQIEFWQGRDNRLHDRIQYIRHSDRWQIQRLAP